MNPARPGILFPLWLWLYTLVVSSLALSFVFAYQEVAFLKVPLRAYASTAFSTLTLMAPVSLPTLVVGYVVYLLWRRQTPGSQQARWAFVWASLGGVLMTHILLFERLPSLREEWSVLGVFFLAIISGGLLFHYLGQRRQRLLQEDGASSPHHSEQP